MIDFRLRVMKIKFYQVDYLWQANILSSELLKNNIENVVIFKPREYAEIVASTFTEKYEILIEEENVTESLVIAEKLFSQNSSPMKLVTEEGNSNFDDGRSYYSKVIFFSFASIVVFPIFFNWVAWQNFKLLQTKSVHKTKLFWARSALIVGLFLSIMEVLFLLKFGISQ